MPYFTGWFLHIKIREFIWISVLRAFIKNLKLIWFQVPWLHFTILLELKGLCIRRKLTKELSIMLVFFALLGGGGRCALKCLHGDGHSSGWNRNLQVFDDFGCIIMSSKLDFQISS
jgi:hypothetical protein